MTTLQLPLLTQKGRHWNRTTKQKPGPAVISTSFLHLLQQEAEASKWHPNINLIQHLGGTGTWGQVGGTQLPSNGILQLQSWSGITGTRTPVFIPLAVLSMCSTQTKANPSEKRLVKVEDKSSSFCCWKFEQDSRTWSYPAAEMHWLDKASACTQQCSLTGRACLSNSFVKAKPLMSQKEITILAQIQFLTTCFVLHWWHSSPLSRKRACAQHQFPHTHQHTHLCYKNFRSRLSVSSTKQLFTAMHGTHHHKNSAKQLFQFIRTTFFG